MRGNIRMYVKISKIPSVQYTVSFRQPTVVYNSIQLDKQQLIKHLIVCGIETK